MDPIPNPGIGASLPARWPRLALLSLIALAYTPMAAPQGGGRGTSPGSPDPPGGGEGEEAAQGRRRARMVVEQLQARDITDPRVLAAMGRVPRHRFVPAEWRPLAYEDRPLPIGSGQTISQPYIVALMSQLVRPAPGDRALDVGTGSGYQAAVLAELVRHVHSIEIRGDLVGEARERLGALGYHNVSVCCGDGYRGWPDAAPFDVILVAAAAPHVPPVLVEQLAPGGRLVLPVGDWDQELLLIEKRPDGSLSRRSIVPVQFVPMTGAAQVPARLP